MRRLIVISLTATLMAVGLAAPASAAPPFDYPCTANEGWQSSPDVTIDSTDAPDGYVSSVKDALEDYWDGDGSVVDDNGVEAGSDWSNLKFGSVNDGAGLTGGDIEISFEDLPGSTLGQALCVVSGGTREITSATIVLDTGVTDQDDQQNVAAHEIGHAIGLQHKGRPGTLMHKYFYEGFDAYLPLARASRTWIARNY